MDVVQGRSHSMTLGTLYKDVFKKRKIMGGISEQVQWCISKGSESRVIGPGLISLVLQGGFENKINGMSW